LKAKRWSAPKIQRPLGKVGPLRTRSCRSADAFCRAGDSRKQAWLGRNRTGSSIHPNRDQPGRRPWELNADPLPGRGRNFRPVLGNRRFWLGSIGLGIHLLGLHTGTLSPRLPPLLFFFGDGWGSLAGPMSSTNLWPHTKISGNPQQRKAKVRHGACLVHFKVGGGPPFDSWGPCWALLPPAGFRSRFACGIQKLREKP